MKKEFYRLGSAIIIFFLFGILSILFISVHKLLTAIVISMGVSIVVFIISNDFREKWRLVFSIAFGIIILSEYVIYYYTNEIYVVTGACAVGLLYLLIPKSGYK